MKLLLSLSYYSPHVSGLTLYAQNLAEGLSKKGDHVTVLTSEHSKQLPLRETFNGVDVFRVPITIQVSKGPIMLGLLAKSITLISGADVVNFHLPQFESAMLAIVAKCLNKKIVVTYHTDLGNEKG